MGDFKPKPLGFRVGPGVEEITPWMDGFLIKDDDILKIPAVSNASLVAQAKAARLANKLIRNMMRV